MKNTDKQQLSLTLLRVTIGLLFLIAGIKKFMGPDGVTGMLSNIGFPAATFFAWILILGEVIFGALILAGYKVKISAWPLAIILAVAVILVVLPNSGVSSSNFYFHLISIAGLIALAFNGPGKYAMTKK